MMKSNIFLYHSATLDLSQYLYINLQSKFCARSRAALFCNCCILHKYFLCSRAPDSDKIIIITLKYTVANTIDINRFDNLF